MPQILKTLFIFSMGITFVFAEPIEQDVQKKISTVKSYPLKKIFKHAKKINKINSSTLKDLKVEKLPDINDEIFVRRVYLDIVGRIPSLTELMNFIESNEKNKRSDLIDQLLDSEAYVSHNFNYWADILRIKDRFTGVQGRSSGKPYIEWMKKVLRENRPYDELVKELLTAKGALYEKGNGATGYYLRDRGMPLDNMSNTARVFLGTRLECAQCHDHPFDKWTQKQFYEMAAFTGGVVTNNVATQKKKREARKELKKRGIKMDQSLKKAFRFIESTIQYGVSGDGAGGIRLPKDYQYDNGMPNQILKAKPLFGRSSNLPAPALIHPNRKFLKKRKKKKKNKKALFKDINSRAVYADWMTSPENPLFTKVIVNRLWKKVMGLGLVNPVDDMRDDTQASDPEMYEELEELMIDLDYDMKQFLRVLYNTEIYQRASFDRDLNALDIYPFQGPLLKRMSGEQVWDSLLSLTIKDIDAHKPIALDLMYDLYEKYSEMSGVELVEAALKMVDQHESKNGFDMNMMMSAMVKESTKKKIGEEVFNIEKERSKERLEILAQIKIAKKLKNKKKLSLLWKEFKAKGFGKPMNNKKQFARASELRSPAANGHLIRQFGGSDRDQIESGSFEPSVTQALTLLNGFVDTRFLKIKSGDLIKKIRSAKSPKERISLITLGLLGRKPSSDEKEWMLEEIRNNKAEGYENICWAILNSREFLFIQ